MPHFDSLLCVDYSAAAVPATGADSIWVGGTLLGKGILENYPTRHALHSWLRDQMSAHLSANKRLLVGFDFAFGYPRGFAKALGLVGTPWSATWAYLADKIEDGPKNQNNRFDVANTINQQLGQRAVFWGRPAKVVLPFLPAKKDVTYDKGLAEWRAFEIDGKQGADRRISRMQSGWKLAYTGSVGSQALMGIAHLEHHRREFGKQLSIWPFEAADTPIVFVEIYPSMFDHTHIDHPVKDARQVLATAQAMANEDFVQWLDRDQFSDDPALISEEGWLLSWPVSKDRALSIA